MFARTVLRLKTFVQLVLRQKLAYMSIFSKVTSSRHLFYTIRYSKTLSLTEYRLISLKQERFERLFPCDLINHKNRQEHE